MGGEGAALIVSRLRPSDDQTAWCEKPADRPIESAAAMRTYLGEFFEELTRVTLHAERHITDATADVCPDLSLPGRRHDDSRRYLEVKALRYKREAILFRHRLDNDRKLTRRGRNASLHYLYWCHDFTAEYPLTVAQLRGRLAASLVCVLSIRGRSLEQAAAELPLHNFRYYADGATMPGYRIPWRALRNLAATQGRLLYPAVAFGIHCPPVPVFGKLP